MRAVLAIALSLTLGLTSAPAVAAASPTTTELTTASRSWAPADQATIRPGAQVSSSTGRCTANFVFTSGQAVYLGSAAHCTSKGTARDTNGCETESLPLGVPVEVEGAAHPATLAYSSWLTMQAVEEDDANACRHNDFALLRLDPRDHERVNPTVPEWGGPLGLSAGASVGDTVYFYGQPDGSRKSQARVEARVDGGWGYLVRAGLVGEDAGVPGDSGSGWLDPSGRAFGVLSTINLTLSNGVSDLRMALDYMRSHADVDAHLAIATEPFTVTGEHPPQQEPDESATGVPVTRLAGGDREATAARVAATYAEADAVVVATGVTPTDALAAGPAAAALGAPLLLSGPSQLSQVTLDQVSRLDPRTAYVIGGTQAVPERVRAQLEELGVAVERVHGPDRYATAVAVARRFGTPGTPLVVASGRGFADALAASPLASAQSGMLVLTDPERLPAVTRGLLAEWDPPAVQVVGGPQVVPQARVDDIRRAAGTDVGRLAGRDRYETGAVVAGALFDSGATFSGELWVASGANFPDALAGGPAVHRNRGLLALVPPTGQLPEPVRDLAERTDGDRVTVLGGDRAVSSAMARQVAQAVGD